MADAAQALGRDAAQRVSDAGRLQLAAFAAAPQHRYLVRAIERPAPIDALPDHRLILARGPFRLADEEALMRDEAIDIHRQQEQRRRRDLREDRGGAHISAFRRHGRAARQAGRSRRRTSVSTQALAWIEAHRAAP